MRAAPVKRMRTVAVLVFVVARRFCVSRPARVVATGATVVGGVLPPPPSAERARGGVCAPRRTQSRRGAVRILATARRWSSGRTTRAAVPRSEAPQRPPGPRASGLKRLVTGGGAWRGGAATSSSLSPPARAPLPADHKEALRCSAVRPPVFTRPSFVFTHLSSRTG